MVLQSVCILRLIKDYAHTKKCSSVNHPHFPSTLLFLFLIVLQLQKIWRVRHLSLEEFSYKNTVLSQNMYFYKAFSTFGLQQYKKAYIFFLYILSTIADLKGTIVTHFQTIQPLI